MEPLTIMIIVGFVVFTASAFLQNHKYRKQEDQRITRERMDAKAAREAEQRRQRLVPEPGKGKAKPGQSVRVPATDSTVHSQSGTSVSQTLVKQELEIRQTGRQVIEQIDTKMHALQAITQEARQTADRLQILIDHFERLVHVHVKSQETADAQPTNVIPNPSITETGPLFQTAEFSGILNELESELDQFHQEMEGVNTEPIETSTRPTVLKEELIAIPDRPVRPVVEKTEPFAHSDPKMPGSGLNPLPSVSRQSPIVMPNIGTAGAGHRITISTTRPAKPQPTGLPFEALYENETPHRDNEPGTVSATVVGSKLEFRKQVELLSDYGYSADQIAQNLNITVGEVEMILHVRRPVRTA